MTSLVVPEVAPESSLSSAPISAMRRKRIAEMIIRAGKMKWAAEKASRPNLLAPVSPSPDDVLIAGWNMLGGVCDSDRVYDLGCGDGRWLLHAARVQTKCVCCGIDISDSHLAKARAEASRLEFSHRVMFVKHDLNGGLPSGIELATVIILYMFSDGMKMLGDHLLAVGLRPGTKILCISFPLDPGTWTPTAQTRVGERTLYLYTTL